MEIDIEFDPAKDEINKRKHGVSLADAGLIEWETAKIIEDDRKDYQETRYQGLGMIGGRLHFITFTFRGNAMRVISLRKANRREGKYYEQG